MKILLLKIAKLIILLFCLACLSCSDDSDADRVLNVNQSTLTFKPGVETKSFEITTTEQWHITSPELSQSFGANCADTDWFEIFPVYGKGDAKITVTTKADSENNNLALHIKYGSQEKILTVIQN